MNRRRLEVEAWRDAMLAVSGELDRDASAARRSTSTRPSNRRRTLYAAVSRHNLDGLLRLFDFPDPNITSDRRTVTTVPLQQLFVLNSEFMERQAKALAARLTADPAESDDAPRSGRRLPAPLRPARATDRRGRARAVEFLGAERDDRRRRTARRRWEQYAQALLGTNEFAFVD